MPVVTLKRFAQSDQKIRVGLKRTSTAMLDYGLASAILFGFAWTGSITMHQAWLFFAAALIVNLVFFLAMASGMTRKLRDPALTPVQVLAGCSINLLGIVLVQPVCHVFIVMLFTTLSYGSLFFKPRVYLLAWAYLALALGAAISVLPPGLRIAIGTGPEQMLSWGAFVLALARFLTLNAEVSRVRADLKTRNAELQAATTQLAELASRDELTGLWNRREFMRLLQEEARRAARSQASFCVAIIDIDGFRQLNDRYGHLVGDAVLRELGQLLEFSRRATDSVGRYGGEEFTLLLQGARLSTATVALERTRNLIVQHDWSSILPELQLTVSAGIAAWHPGDTLTAVMNRADAALLEAKNAGRNCVRALDR